jgi:short-subunit dehydrogenase
MPTHRRPLAVVTGASPGIDYELAKCCVENGFDLVIAADSPAIGTPRRPSAASAPR